MISFEFENLKKVATQIDAACRAFQEFGLQAIHAESLVQKSKDVDTFSWWLNSLQHLAIIEEDMIFDIYHPILNLCSKRPFVGMNEELKEAYMRLKFRAIQRMQSTSKHSKSDIKDENN
jgi:hypothetical protein